jgi:hypothetical protein
MNDLRLDKPASLRRPFAPMDEDIVELSLLLPEWEMEALEEAACRHGLTAGEAVRRLIRSFLRKSSV